MEKTQQTTQQTKIPKGWPFPVVNSQRTEESLALLKQKHVKSKPDDLSDFPESLF